MNAFKPQPSAGEGRATQQLAAVNAFKPQPSDSEQQPPSAGEGRATQQLATVGTYKPPPAQSAHGGSGGGHGFSDLFPPLPSLKEQRPSTTELALAGSLSLELPLIVSTAPPASQKAAADAPQLPVPQPVVPPAAAAADLDLVGTTAEEKYGSHHVRNYLLRVHRQRKAKAADADVAHAPQQLAAAPAYEWCPGSCAAATASVGSSADSALAWKASDRGAAAAAAPSCDLCEKPWLFVVSVGGRTGSTTVLDMLDAHPHIRLAGENNGQMVSAAQLWAEATASDYDSSPVTNARGAIQPADLLCSMQAWFETSTTPTLATAPGASVIRGCKDITWTPEALRMIDRLFPCNRKIFSVRSNGTAHALSQAHAFDRVGAFAVKAQAEQALEPQLMRLATQMHADDVRSGRPWRSYWMDLPDTGFETAQFNNLLGWLGETGCQFDGVVHANAPYAGASRGGYDNAHATVADAQSLLKGSCTLTRIGTRSATLGR